ncbi:MAG: hypothetical protein AB1792_08510 [Candidatus Zixiibacteriota bacterium]
MTPPDPMALPAPVELLQFLFGLTFVLHIGFLGLLVAALWAKAGAEWGRRPSYDPERLHRAGVLGFSMTITAGVAPLLFVQVLYGKSFYSSSIKIGFPWLAIIAYLLIGFYALYLSRFRWDKAGGPSASGKGYLILAMLMVFAIGFTYSWNHLQSLTARPWADRISHALAARRLSGYGGVAFIASAAWATWFGRLWRRDGATPSGAKWASLAGAAFVLIWALVSDFTSDGWGQNGKRLLLTSGLLSIIGFALLWARQSVTARFIPWVRWTSLVAALAGALGLVLQRESWRLHTLSANSGASVEPVRMQWGPFVMFALALVVGLLVLAWMLMQVRRPPGTSSQTY